MKQAQLLDTLLVEIMQTLEEKANAKPLSDLVTQLEQQILSYPQDQYTVSHWVRFTDIMRLVTQQRCNSTKREAVLQGDLGTYLFRINSIISHVVYNQACLQDKLDDYLLSPETETSGNKDLGSILNAAFNTVIEANGKFEAASAAIDQKIQETEQLGIELKGAKFKTSKTHKQGLTPELEQKAVKTLADMYTFTTAAALTADVAAIAQTHYEQLIENARC